MRHHQKMCVRAAICRIAAVSLVLQTILPGAVPAEEISSGMVSAEETRPETALTEKILPESELTLETETESMEPRERVVISEARDLDELAKRCAVDVNSAHLEVVLTADISMAGRKFTPIPFSQESLTDRGIRSGESGFARTDLTRVCSAIPGRTR